MKVATGSETAGKGLAVVLRAGGLGGIKVAVLVGAMGSTVIVYVGVAGCSKVMVNMGVGVAVSICSIKAAKIQASL
jgi:hypothetical protein